LEQIIMTIPVAPASWREFEQQVEALLPGATAAPDYCPGSLAELAVSDGFKPDEYSAKFTLAGVHCSVTYRFGRAVWLVQATTQNNRVGEGVSQTSLDRALRDAVAQVELRLTQESKAASDGLQALDALRGSVDKVVS